MTSSVTAKVIGNMIMLKYRDTEKYAGAINEPILSTLLEKSHVDYDITLTASSVAQDLNPRKGKKKTTSSKSKVAHFVIYGLKANISIVGNALSEAGLYLQHPSISECDRAVEYFNPHYLVRPGDEMPSLSELSISSDGDPVKTFDILDEVGRSRLVQLFDSANADSRGIVSQIKPSSRLKTTLKP